MAAAPDMTLILVTVVLKQSEESGQTLELPIYASIVGKYRIRTDVLSVG